jgi:hypothetical protein
VQGINRLAAPVERLRAKFAEFQQRMVGRGVWYLGPGWVLIRVHMDGWVLPSRVW